MTNTRLSPNPAFLLLTALVLLVSACASDEQLSGAADLVDGGAAVVVANSPGTLTTNGPQRVLVALLGEGANSFLGGADQPATIEFRSVDGGITGEGSGQWLSSPGVALGLYVVTYDFDEPGQWEVRIKSNSDAAAAATIQVGTESSVPELGDAAPPSVTATATTAELAKITTDPNPEPRFYQLSVADAVSNGRPSVIVFSTPAFCQTALCGPTIEIAKDVAADNPDVDFVHVEPFDIEQARAGSLAPISAMTEWGLATEPWVFVVDQNGAITASFEGIIGQDELETALTAL